MTEREITIWKLIASSVNTKSIAGKLGITDKCVEWHRANLKRKLRIPDVAGLTREAMRKGMIAI